MFIIFNDISEIKGQETFRSPHFLYSSSSLKKKRTKKLHSESAQFFFFPQGHNLYQTGDYHRQSKYQCYWWRFCWKMSFVPEVEQQQKRNVQKRKSQILSKTTNKTPAHCHADKKKKKTQIWLEDEVRRRSAVLRRQRSFLWPSEQNCIFDNWFSFFNSLVSLQTKDRSCRWLLFLVFVPLFLFHSVETENSDYYGMDFSRHFLKSLIMHLDAQNLLFK